ncbi:hypothetical protein PVAG01_04812 [Phlyctema vagabunda]|uniref:2EXR domain-containing protein n=1 Tax=Phlyctema vagabunda TaxID=108571 RepID=A0ABR4PID8_9HELO
MAPSSSSSSSSSSLPFPIFSLPPEIRLYVWEFCLPGPRIIHLKTQYAIHRNPLRRTKKQECRATLSSPRILLTLLHLCHESRAVVLARYQALFTSAIPRSRVIRFHQHYFDPQHDGVFLDELFSPIRDKRAIWPWATTISKPAGVENIRFLCINCNCWWRLWQGNALFSKEGLISLQHLEEIHIIFRVRLDEDDRADVSDGTDFSYPWFHVDIRLEEVTRAVRAAWKAFPDRKVPKVKLVGWVKRH